MAISPTLVEQEISIQEREYAPLVLADFREGLHGLGEDEQPQYCRRWWRMYHDIIPIDKNGRSDE